MNETSEFLWMNFYPNLENDVVWVCDIDIHISFDVGSSEMMAVDFRNARVHPGPIVVCVVEGLLDSFTEFCIYRIKGW